MPVDHMTRALHAYFYMSIYTRMRGRYISISIKSAALSTYLKCISFNIRLMQGDTTHPHMRRHCSCVMFGKNQKIQRVVVVMDQGRMDTLWGEETWEYSLSMS